VATVVFTVRRLIVLIDWFWMFVLGEFEKEQLTKGRRGGAIKVQHRTGTK